MDYTEKYHLPQWEKTDRVMMEDFNQMCLDMEAGLEKTAGDAAAESAQLKADGSAAARTAFDRLYRLTYNHYRAAQAVDPFPRQMGAFYQDYSQSGSVTGMVRIGDFLWTGGNQTALTYSEMLDFVNQTTHIDNNSDTCTVLFTPPKAAWLEKIRMVYHYSSTATGERATTLRLYDTTENRCLVTHDTSFSFKTTSSGGGYSEHPVGCSILAGHDYRLEITMDRTDLTYCDIYLPFKASDSSFTLKSAGGGEPAPFTYHFQEDAGSSGGLFLVHYIPDGPDSGLVLKWDGTEYAPTGMRTVTDNQGRTVQEAEFLIEREVPADSTVSLRLDCTSKSRAFRFYDWGGILMG